MDEDARDVVIAVEKLSEVAEKILGALERIEEGLKDIAYDVKETGKTLGNIENSASELKEIASVARKAIDTFK